jgi:phosphate transport system substrate-binding protein
MLMLPFVVALAAAQPVLDSDVPDYHPSTTLKGTLSFGPDGGFEHLLGLWAEKLKTYHPDLSGPTYPRTNPALVPEAMLVGVARCGMLTRAWTGREVAEFKDYTGSLPIELIVGADAVTIVVHRDNPLRGAKLDDLDAIFSSTQRRASRAVRTWGELGSGDSWKGKAIHVYVLKAGEASSSPARQVFIDRVLDRGQIRDDAKELVGAEAVLQAVAEDPLAIGFVPYRAGSKNVRVVPLLSADGVVQEVEKDAILNLTYPLAWQLRLCYRNDRGSVLEPSLREFLALILSRDGQTILAEEGYVPISGPIARKQIKLLK